MSRNVFGWDYPPGAEHDPMAPWNQHDEDEDEDEDGETPLERKERMAEEKADYERDRDKDEDDMQYEPRDRLGERDKHIKD